MDNQTKPHLFHKTVNHSLRYQHLIRKEVFPLDTLADRNYISFPEKNSCKGYTLRQFSYPAEMTDAMATKLKMGMPAASSQQLLKIKGNILYDVNYRSYVDTPFAKKNVYQHTIQTYLDLTWKNKYPFRLNLNYHFSNSPYFKNYSDFNFQYNPNEFSNKIKKQLIDILLKKIKYDSLEAMEKQLEQKKKEYASLNDWMKNPALLQKLVEEREKQIVRQNPVDTINKKTYLADKNKLEALLKQPNFKFNKSGNTDSLDIFRKKDSVTKKIERIDSAYAKKKKKLDSLRLEIKKLDSMYEVAKLFKKSNTDQLKKEIEETTTTSALKDKMQKLHVADTLLPKGYKTLFALKSFGIGRSIVDYSELSAKNISVNGLQAEYNPHYYYAVAAGLVDYRFQNYIISTPGAQKQYLALFRAGKGEKLGNHIIFTYYTGRRQMYNVSTTTSGNTIPNYNLMGITIETRYNINRSNYITAEIAKSSLPYYSLDSTKGRNLFSNMFKMSDHSNTAAAVNLVSFIPATQTSINASYRYSGSNFQSFSLFTNGSAQTAWSVRVNQPFFKRRLMITAGIRENDFSNTFVSTAYQTNAIMESIQATLHIKKWPVLSLGYFPSEQLTKLGDGRFSENLFYTLMGTASHFYHYRHVQFNTMLVYTQFYNKSSDSGFVYFNTKNLLLSQAAFFGKVNLQLNLSAAANTSYHLYVVEENLNYALSKWLSLGGGLKYNKQTVFNIEQWGYAGNMKIRIPLLGSLQLMMDKGFVPGPDKQLVPNNMGRLTYLKTF